jgi:HK97 gp10 family phage protein
MPRSHVTLTVDPTETKDEVFARAIGGLRRAATFALGRSKYHAPVRAIFKRTRRGKATPKSWRYIRSENQYQRFMKSKAPERGMNIAGIQGAGTIRGGNAGGYIGGRERRVRHKGHQGLVGDRGLRTGIGGLNTRFSGHNNSLFPVFQKGGYRITGDFRSAAPLTEAIKQRKGKNQTLVEGKTRKLGRSRAELASGRVKMLSGRGRYEVTSRRGLHKGRIGGRLQDELRVTDPVKHGDVVWMYVESPTPYAVHQEFGTSRHRAQPFLRPALYESRNVLRTEVRKSLKQPMADSLRRTDDRLSSRKRGK